MVRLSKVACCTASITRACSPALCNAPAPSLATRRLMLIVPTTPWSTQTCYRSNMCGLLCHHWRSWFRRGACGRCASGCCNPCWCRWWPAVVVLSRQQVCCRLSCVTTCTSRPSITVSRAPVTARAMAFGALRPLFHTEHCTCAATGVMQKALRLLSTTACTLGGGGASAFCHSKQCFSLRNQRLLTLCGANRQALHCMRWYQAPANSRCVPPPECKTRQTATRA